ARGAGGRVRAGAGERGARPHHVGGRPRRGGDELAHPRAHPQGGAARRGRLGGRGAPPARRLGGARGGRRRAHPPGAARVAPGARVKLEGWGGEAALGGRVRLVEPSAFTKISALGVEEQRVAVLIDLDDPKAAARSLGDGYRIEARILLWESASVVR